MKEKKWRIAYYQGGNSYAYYPYLAAVVKGLIDLGWIERIELPIIVDKDPKKLWSWLGQNIKSPYIEFPIDAFFNANWSNTTRIEVVNTILERLNKKKDIDLIIAMGTWAGKDLANNKHNTPTMVMSSTDPKNSGIIESNEDSGQDHLFARVDPNRWERQVRIFYNTIGFKKLGIAYEDSPLGKTYAAIDVIESLAKEKNFQIVRCFTKDDIPDKEQAGQSVVKCFENLAPQVDAIYVVIQQGVNSTTIPKLVSIANRYRIPTFSQQGSDEVKAGLLMSIAREGGFAPVGRFLAVSMAKILNGAKPRELNQIFEEAPTIALNLKTAEIIGLYLKAEILAAADEIYQDITIPTSN
ncbi:ABC transporter substrate-binding protein [Candidatus Competibacter phosphatis]|uniref:ABC transporter substrate-binding protein n=1 Tax=Candidatus Competibacter phosphatis TaxID=221280 RepID=A0ABX1TMQ4_9GAMM|nr:ABC transporter substrate-binding protein [Candidatus Competibacter phosphatis]